MSGRYGAYELPGRCTRHYIVMRYRDRELIFPIVFYPSAAAAAAAAPLKRIRRHAHRVHYLDNGGARVLTAKC